MIDPLKVPEMLKRAFYAGYQHGYQAGAASAEGASNAFGQFLPSAMDGLTLKRPMTATEIKKGRNKILGQEEAIHE